ncbi:hypothetical protein CGCTS75_v005513 [Colletotrichum tropicale]|nr:hypothetical protein CGCTS75_v005513 [Colletotrichum tropicale]
MTRMGMRFGTSMATVRMPITTPTTLSASARREDSTVVPSSEIGDIAPEQSIVRLLRIFGTATGMTFSSARSIISSPGNPSRRPKRSRT